MKQKQKLLLLKDVEDLGKSGEVIAVKPGYARNFLLPKKMAMVADRTTLRRQEKLKKERLIIAEKEKAKALEIAKIIENITLTITVKVDPEGKMYGSVSHQDIVDLFEKEGIILTRKNIGIKKAIKETGEIEIPIKLKEDVEAKVVLKIVPDKVIVEKKTEEKKEEIPEEKKEEKTEE